VIHGRSNITTKPRMFSLIGHEQVQYGFVNMLKHFVECVIEGKEPLSTGDFGREVLRVVFAGYESHRKGKTISL
ncbi:MAG: hypothetical protein ACE5NN_05300, partial [Candidatus Bathyarchaeia archaeon]